MKKDIGIYIHIPFCKSKCYYCDFVSYCKYENDTIEKYIDALCNEIIQKADILSECNIKTIYFGGGTPSFIDEKYIEKIMNILSLFLKDDEKREITIEVNPNTVNYDKLMLYKKCGINRLSIGLQSTHDKVLKNIGRTHTYSDVLNILEISKKIDFTNISVDVIYPLPGLSVKMFDDTLNTLLTLKENYNIKHMSIYNLEIHENTKLYFLLNEGFLSLVDEDEEYVMYQHLINTLESNNFNRYEISNFSLLGYESKHNLNYWNQGEYLGFGVSASSFYAGSRYKNIDNIDSYINSIQNYKSIILQREDLDKLAMIKEYIILKLRLKNGINKKEFFNRFNVNIYDLFKIELDELFSYKLLEESKDNIYLSNRGKEVANLVWEKFI